MLRSLHMMTFDPILKSTYEHLVIKTFSQCFKTYIYKHTKFGSKRNVFTYKKIKLFYSCKYFLILHSMTFDLISGLPIQIQTWHPPLWLCTHAKYYVKSGLTNVLKNANRTKNMHLFFDSDCQLTGDLRSYVYVRKLFQYNYKLLN